MYLTADKMKEIFALYGKSEADTGSTDSQVALFTFRIQELTKHVKENHKDLFTKRALVNLVGKRRRMLDYLKEQDIERYRELIKKLGIRK